MKLVIIIGSGAVGKMTVGYELTKITDLSLFHNHMIIEPVLKVFKTFDKQVIKQLREVFFNNFAKSNNYGLIFTFMLAFEDQEDKDYIYSVIKLFESYSSEIYCVELRASEEIRLLRNKTEFRLNQKESKRDIDFSTDLIIKERRHRFESFENEMDIKNYLIIENSYIEAKDVAKMIKDKFNL